MEYIAKIKGIGKGKEKGAVKVEGKKRHID